MGLRADWLAIDCNDPVRLAEFWMAVLGWERSPEDEGDPDEVAIEAPGSDTQQGVRRLLFLRVPEDKTVKNRLHLDLRPDDQSLEIARVLDLGAKPVDIGQRGDESWVVLADIEGN